ncbi:hypothetical protein [Nocardia abscessus]|uniref:hypothetical protein n=1 Tax=Nocardia abscessus TaxID=120957 RepID=UPI0024556F21|nr:hypothetical protein [Nocardia abscessus]
MSLSLPALGGTARKAGDLALGVNVMVKRRLFNPLRPDHAARSAFNVLKFGPFAGVVMHAAQTRPEAAAIVDERGEGGGRARQQPQHHPRPRGAPPRRGAPPPPPLTPTRSRRSPSGHGSWPHAGAGF